QLLFAFTVASFYGRTAARGDWWAWNQSITHGHVAGNRTGNLVVASHLLSAVIILIAGAIQLVPRIRERFPKFHRWTGRTYMLSAITLSTAGVYMHFVHGSVGGLSAKIGLTLNAVLIWVCVAMALRYAMVRNFRAHRRWALRLFLVVSASWFFRIGFFLSLLLNKGPFGFDPVTFTGPFLTFMIFAQYVVPLAVLELYFLAQARPGGLRRLAMASGLVVLTVGTAAGTFAVTAIKWAPSLKAAYDSRKSIVQTLSVTIASRGIDAAVKQYRELKTAQHAIYNFDENQLNILGYQFVRAKKFKDAVRIFELNIEAYPKSANVYDSLAEAYLKGGEKVLAITN